MLTYDFKGALQLNRSIGKGKFNKYSLECYREQLFQNINYILILTLQFVLIECNPKTNLREIKGKTVVVLGIDGMDPENLAQLMKKDRMPNFRRLADEGDFRRLWTSNSPQSLVAWSTFITGENSPKNSL